MWHVLIKIHPTFSPNFSDPFDSKPLFEPLLVFSHFQIKNASPISIFLFEDISKVIFKTQFE
jgi:hypothetical protein